MLKVVLTQVALDIAPKRDRHNQTERLVSDHAARLDRDRVALRPGQRDRSNREHIGPWSRTSVGQTSANHTSDQHRDTQRDS